MKTLSSSIAIVLAFTLLSCRRSDDNTNNIPSPIQPDKSGSLLLTKRYPQTILDEIYNDALTKNTELQKLNKEIDVYNDEKRDSLAGANKYLHYSTDYYSAGDDLVKSVKDSILQEQLQELISKSEARYNKETGKLKSLVSSINKSEASINDCYLALKLIVTLPIIENYQKENLSAVIKKINKVAVKGDGVKQKTARAAEKYENKLK